MLYFFHLLPIASLYSYHFPRNQVLLTSTNRLDKTDQNRFYSRMYAYRCSTQLVAAPLNNNLNALLKQHFNEWQTLPLCHTLSRNCFTKIAVSFKSIPHQNKIIISKIYCMYQKKYCFYCPASTKTKYDITFPVLTARRCLP